MKRIFCRISLAVIFATLACVDASASIQLNVDDYTATITVGSKSDMRAALLADPKLRQFFEEKLQSCIDGSCDIEFKTTITGKDGADDGTAVSTTQQEVFKAATSQTEKEEKQSTATQDIAYSTVVLDDSQYLATTSRMPLNCSYVTEFSTSEHSSSKYYNDYCELDNDDWKGYGCEIGMFWYKIFNKIASYNESKRACSTEKNSTLASEGMRNPAIRKKVLEDYVMPRKNSSVWIGLTGGGNSSWVWADGTFSNHSNTDWYSSEPNGNIEQCGRLLQNYNFQVDDAECKVENRFHYMCEKVFQYPK